MEDLAVDNNVVLSKCIRSCSSEGGDSVKDLTSTDTSDEAKTVLGTLLCLHRIFHY